MDETEVMRFSMTKAFDLYPHLESLYAKPRTRGKKRAHGAYELKQAIYSQEKKLAKIAHGQVRAKPVQLLAKPVHEPTPTRSSSASTVCTELMDTTAAETEEVAPRVRFSPCYSRQADHAVLQCSSPQPVSPLSTLSASPSKLSPSKLSVGEVLYLWSGHERRSH